MHPHTHAQMQMQMQQQPVRPQYLPSPPFPSAPPPSRQASELAHMQVCGPGSLLSQQSGSSDGDQPAELANRRAIADPMHLNTGKFLGSVRQRL